MLTNKRTKECKWFTIFLFTAKISIPRLVTAIRLYYVEQWFLLNALDNTAKQKFTIKLS